MKISIDLDDTILVKSDSIHIEENTTALVRGFIEEYFRRGTRKLFAFLSANNVEVGVYTNSYRGKSALDKWFSDNNFHISFVINQQLHDVKRDTQEKPYSLPPKCPHLFDIDIHIDDLEAIKIEAEKFGPTVILASPNEDWAELIIDELKHYL